MISFVSSTLLLFLLLFFTPYWWWIIVVPLLFGFWKSESGWRAFRDGSFSSGIVWISGALYYYWTESDIIARRVAEMFTLPSPWLLILATTLVAVICGGVAASTGFSFRSAFRKEARDGTTS